MKGFFQWFKASSKMKRWMFLILVGIILICYALAEILVTKEISIEEVAEIAIIFIIGFISIVLGLIFLNKRTLEIFVEATDERMKNKDKVNINSLIFNKTVYDKGPNIVVIGGGSGLNTVLTGLKNYTSNLTAIVTVSDYGEEITKSRKELDVLPLNDVRDSLVSLATKDGTLDKLFNYKFEKGILEGINFSDIYFSAMKEINGNFEDSIVKSNEILNIIGKVIPSTLDEMKIVAELANGYMVEDRSRIPEVVYDRVTKINRILLRPSNCRPAPGVMEAIQNADCIIIGPGSLYTNVIPNLLVNGIAKAIKESSAIKVYISNIMTEPGQTDNYTLSDHINAIVEHVGQGLIDYCIYDTCDIAPEVIRKYNLKGQEIVEQDAYKVREIKLLRKNASIIKGEYIRHDANLLASYIIELICDDLKYKDKEKDPQYIMLNTKLKEEKRISKIKKRMEKKEKKHRKRGEPTKPKRLKSKSKFSHKYSDRIESIKEADAKVRMKMEEEAIKAKVKMEQEERKAREKAEKEEAKKEKEEAKKAKKEAKTKTTTRTRRTKKDTETGTEEKATKPKSARGRKKAQ